jgi:hypothetical protein
MFNINIIIGIPDFKILIRKVPLPLFIDEFVRSSALGLPINIHIATIVIKICPSRRPELAKASA